MVGFVPEPDGRGTVGILWSCLTTIFLSTWTSFHRDWKKGRSFLSKLSQLFVCVVFPEGVAASALEDFMNARQLQKVLRTNPGWEQCSLKQVFLIQKEAINIRPNPISRPLYFHQFVTEIYRRKIKFDQFPSNAEIDARSHSDWLSKLIAIFQSIWFAVNIIARLASGCEISLLEGLTCAYVFCGLVMFISWYHCPKDIEDIFIIDAEVEDRTDASQVFAPSVQNVSDTVLLSIATTFLAIFAGIHLAAWYYPFPSTVEAWLWRACNIATFVLGLASFAVVTFEEELNGRDVFISIVPVVGYILVRLGVTGVAFAVLRQAPAGIYVTPSWPAYWGHIGG